MEKLRSTPHSSFFSFLCKIHNNAIHTYLKERQVFENDNSVPTLLSPSLRGADVEIPSKLTGGEMTWQVPAWTRRPSPPLKGQQWDTNEALALVSHDCPRPVLIAAEERRKSHSVSYAHALCPLWKQLYSPRTVATCPSFLI